MNAAAADFNATALTQGWPSLCDPATEFSHPDLRRLLGMWRHQAKADGVPRYADLPPRQLKSFLADIVLYERIATAERRWRVSRMGSSFAQIMGDLTAKFLDETVAPELLPRWHASLDAAYGAGAPLRFLARVDTNKMSFLTGEYFTAPLRADDGSPSLILAAGRFSGGRKWQDVEAEARLTLERA